MLVRDLMTPSVVTATPNETVANLARRMHEAHVTAVVISDDGKPYGIFSDRDVLPVVAQGLDPETEIARDHMRADCATIRPDTPIDEAARIMAECEMGHLPVMENEICIGMFTAWDLVEWCERQRTEPQTDLRLVVEGQELPGRK